jgi:DNA-binding CsgD family transcriptional regulator
VVTTARRSVTFLWSRFPAAGSDTAIVTIADTEPAPALAPLRRTQVMTQTDRADHAGNDLRLSGAPPDVRVGADAQVSRPVDVSERRSCPQGARPVLSAREREIMQMVLHGKRVSTVAAALFLSENTVRNHLKRVYRKLGVASIGELRERVQPSQKAS